MTVRHPGFCKVCGEPSYAFERQFPIGHPLAGRPIQLGRPMSDVVRVNLVLSDGSWATIVVHQKCVDDIGPEMLPALWRDVLETTKFEHDNRALLGSKPLRPDQEKHLQKTLRKMASTIPLGVSCITPMEKRA